jgi:hypothetical protein
MSTFEHDIAGEQKQVFQTTEISAGSEATVPVLIAPFELKVSSVYVTFNEDITGNDSGYFKLDLCKADGTILATYSFTAGNDLTAYDGLELTLQDAADNEIDAGTTLYLEKTEPAGTMKFPDCAGYVAVKGN